ncbi:hypothetical protein KA089_02185 [Candidatus Woesebacteria bacterium]|nr:hypothetical protein [Candidatus Woesebacteria bacterium]
MKNKDIEKLENKYLKKFYHFLSFAKDEMLEGFRTKEKIKSDWLGLYKTGISDFSTGAERIVYALFNGKGFGQPNSSPVGSDLFFEVSDAFIHIDLKTVGASLSGKNNIGDYSKNIFVGTNQNSYKGEILLKSKNSIIKKRDYIPSLPTFYNKGTEHEKICLSYFVTILYDKDTLDILVISIMCMPNGELESHYKTRVLKAGKNDDKARFGFSDVPNFELIDSTPKRIKVIFFDTNMDEKYLKKLNFYEDIYNKQEIN